MPTAVAGPEIERLIQLLARLPGLGPRSARRAALHLIKKRELLMAPLASALQTAMEKIVICKTCGNIDTQNPCTVCTDTSATSRSSWWWPTSPTCGRSSARTRSTAAITCSAARCRRSTASARRTCSIDALISRAHEPQVKELILALNATVDGQTTAHYITELLHEAGVKVTRLAHGVPVGGELDYLDEGTLSAAIKQRTLF